MIFTLSKNVLSFDETLQSHKYFWLSHVYGNIAFYLYYLNYGDGVLWEYRDLFPLWFKNPY